MINISDIDISQFEAESAKYFGNKITFDSERRTAIKSFDDIQACPGSGKTTLVVAKLIMMAKKWNKSFKGICVLSHTNVAKNEIISRLEKHPDGVKLLRYPHFIGTIQEFVNRFLGIPYCRYKKWPVNYIDDYRCVSYIERNLTRTIYFQRTSLPYPPSLYDLQYRYEENKELIVKLPIPNGQSSATQTGQDFMKIKKDLVEKEGGYFYSEMYEFAKAYLDKDESLSNILQNRYPYVFIDEMQDVDVVQDSIISKIFDSSISIIQRFGDPDQAIYRDDEDGNQSFNKNSELSTITYSHRFTSSIAELVSPCSFNGLKLESRNHHKHQHTIFLVDENSRREAIPAFAKLCLEENILNYNLPIKAVGSIGKEKEDMKQLRIVDYLDVFHKSKIHSNYYAEYFIDYIYYAKHLLKTSGNYSLSYESFLKGLQNYFNKMNYSFFIDDEKIQPTVSELKKYLIQSKLYIDVNSIFLQMLKLDLTHINWRKFIDKLQGIFEMTSMATDDFFLYKENDNLVEEEGNVNGNNFCLTVDDQEIIIEVGTIHSVKGETHGATLVLETKRNKFNFESIIDLILELESKRPTNKQKNRMALMKETYVGMTRPRYLLGLACDKSIFYNDKNGEERRDKARALGWNIEDLTI